MRLRTILAGTALTLALAACSGGSEEETTAAQDATAETVATDEAAVEPATDDAADAAKEAEKAPEEAAVEEKAAEPEPTPTPTPTATPTAAPAEEPKIAANEPPKIFTQRCALCHTANKGGEDKLGPNLFGVYGKPAAEGSFSYSEAFKGAGLTMDEATLHQWLENPRKLVPGNRMSFPGLKDAAKRQEIIDYLKQQK
ncbi:c-type cytochrome [Altererythrobacter sp.]|uniref:c-type cytochrome n=1 Tax=Altererythrobacter sp. TaxID=1872480 RepID=UPI003D0C151F